jgi:hypothetical protein
MTTVVESSPMSRPAWRTLRAAFIAAAIGVGLVDGAPVPTARVMEGFPPLLRDVSTSLQNLQATLLTPVRPIKELFLVSQRWSVFSTTGGIRYRMWVEARTGSDPTWTLLYRAQDPEHTFLGETLGYRRVKNVYNPSRSIGAKSTYGAFASWLARQIFQREPRFDEVRIGMERGRTLARGEGFAPLGEFDYVLVRRRDEVMP